MNINVFTLAGTETRLPTVTQNGLSRLCVFSFSTVRFVMVSSEWCTNELKMLSSSFSFPDRSSSATPFALRLILGRGGLCVCPTAFLDVKFISRLDGLTPLFLRQALQLHSPLQNGHSQVLYLKQSLIRTMYLFHRQELQYFLVHGFMTVAVSATALSSPFFFRVSLKRDVQNASLSSVFDNLH